MPGRCDVRSPAGTIARTAPIGWVVAGLAVAAGTAIHGGVGFGLSGFTRRRVDRGRARAAVLLVAAAPAITVLARAVF